MIHRFNKGEGLRSYPLLPFSQTENKHKKEIDFMMYLITILFPPLAVLLYSNLGDDWLSILGLLLLIIGWIL